MKSAVEHIEGLATRLERAAQKGWNEAADLQAEVERIRDAASRDHLEAAELRATVEILKGRRT